MFRRYACVRQVDASDCGAAALATVALHYRRPIGLQQMRDLAGTDRIGTNLLGLVRAAENLGFLARGVKASAEALPQAPLPAIAHVRNEVGGHFVVVHRLTRHGVVVADPALGVQTIPRDEFGRLWTGYLLLLAPADDTAPARPGQSPPSPWGRFVRLLRGHTPLLAEAFLCALLMTLLGVGTSYFVQHLVDSVLVRRETRLLNALGVGMGLIVLFRASFGVLRQYLLAHVGRKIDLALVGGYFRHLLGLPLRFFEMRRAGEILSRLNDASKVREAVSGTAATAVVDGTLVVLLVGVLWLSDLPLAAAATAFIPVLVLAVMAHHPAANRRSRETMEHGAQLSAHLVENVTAVETVKSCGAEHGRTEEGEVRLFHFAESLFSLQKLFISMTSLATLVTAAAGLAILWYGGHRVMAGALSIGQLLFFYSLLGIMLEPLERLASVNLKLQEALVAIDRLYQIMDLELEAKGETKRIPFRGVGTAVEFQAASFGYGSRGNVLEQVDLRIPAGSTVAIVGESGSGKSTLLKLLLGFYTPTEGRVVVDGVDLRDIDLESLRRGVGVVSQDPFIFNGTVRDNIALGIPRATLEEVMQAAREAGLAEVITRLPDRYETVIGERGTNLSGGQRQRLAIARALLRNPDILIFDEATSHLDTATERAIQDSLRKRLAGKTVVLVAHRLSTIKGADLICVLRRGRIVEQGSHAQLMARGGEYAALWQAQIEDGPASTRPSARGGLAQEGTRDTALVSVNGERHE
jgi:ATP-binding cassette subfamily B protein